LDKLSCGTSSTAGLQLAQCGVGNTLLSGADHRRVHGGTEGIAPLLELVLEQTLLATRGVQRTTGQGMAFLQGQQALCGAPLAGWHVAEWVCRMRQTHSISA